MHPTTNPVVTVARRLATQVIHDPTTAAKALTELKLSGAFAITNGAIEFHVSGLIEIPSVTSGPIASEHVPSGYGFKGGVARHALAVALAKDIRFDAKAHAPRDVDLVRRFGHSGVADEELLRTVNFSDFERGAKVEEIRDLGLYFASRDLTINEVLVFEQRGFCTALCILDFIGRTLRPTKYRGGSLHAKRKLAPMTVAKCLRLAAESESSATGWLVVGIPEEQEVTSLALAVQLRKALERDLDVARSFLRFCIESGVRFEPENLEVPPERAFGIPEFLEELLLDLPEGRSFFSEQELTALSKL